MYIVQKNAADRMEQKAQSMSGQTDLDQKDLNELQVLTELYKATNQSTQAVISAVGEGMSVAARATNR
ncbi:MULTISPECIES: hypothetical protein [Burkholderia]|nr:MULTISPECIES: hypothetical protein [Burkholderia]